MDNPYDRTNIGLRERPVSSDLNQMQAQIYRTICELARMTFSGRTSNVSSAMASASGFLHDGMRAVPSSPAAMSVSVNSGFGFNYDAADLVANIGATDLEHVDDLAPFKPLSLLSPVAFAVPTAPGSPNSRIDIIEVKTDRRLENGVTRRQLDPGTESFLDHVFFKTLAYNLDGRTGVVTNPAASTAGLSYKIGTAANPGLVPATTAGYTKIAEINVPNGTTSISGANIVDRRRMIGVGGVVRASVVVRGQFLGAPGAPGSATIVSVNAPPGIDIGVIPFAGTGEKGNFVLYVTAGEFTRITSVVTPQQNLSIVGGRQITFTPPIVTLSVGVASGVRVVDSGSQPSLIAAGTPAGIGQVYYELLSSGSTVYRDAAGAGSVVNALLDDVLFNVGLDIAYY